MSEPKVAAKSPKVLTLEPGTYYWCACGYSSDQPYCDGSHEGKGIEPMEFTVGETKKLALCQCKKTATPPYCDGSHSDL